MKTIRELYGSDLPGVIDHLEEWLKTALVDPNPLARDSALESICTICGDVVGGFEGDNQLFIRIKSNSRPYLAFLCDKPWE
tara:strand:- start:6707 stop:6949 length:243 start_codon:yes stop_codon:yes gene_type:complete